MMLRLFQHLLPRALAWSTTAPKRLRQYFEGLASLPSDVRTFVDLVYLDLVPGTTRELVAWETQFALSPGGSEAERRAKLAATWAIQGRQSPDYIQRTLQAAGFDVYVHEWWASGPPYVARDPREHTTQPLIGIYQCEADGVEQWQCFDSGPGDLLAPHCDGYLANDPGYLVNLDLTRRAPPPVPSDPGFWPYFVYIGGETFPELAPVPISRVAELKALLLRIVPAQQWIVLLIDPVDDLDGGFGSGGFGVAPFGT
jgi:hypothetical protein